MDSYEKEGQRLRELLDECSDEDADLSEEDPFAGDNIDVDLDYIPSGNDDSDDNDEEMDEETNENDEIEITNPIDDMEQEDSFGEWSKTTKPIPHFQFDEANAGCQLEIDINTTPEYLFGKMFSEELVSMIVNCTNEYGTLLAHSHLRKKTRNSRPKSFKPVDSAELLKFFGLCLLQGQIKTPKIRDLFSTKGLYHHPIFPATMSGRRFEQILRCLNVNPNADVKHLDKINSFLHIFIKCSQSCYKPKKNLSLDESLLLFRGRLYFRQYIKNKKAKYGIKFFELCDPNGYVFNLKIYAGKEDVEIQSSKTNDLVMQLMQPYIGNGHYLFMDNYYNSVGLSNLLLSNRTHTVGTLRSNRKGNPKDLTNKKLKKGEYDWAQKGSIYVSKWKDKRDVLCINTAYHPELKITTNRWGQEKNKPIEVEQYNLNMAGVDRVDQMTSYYSSPRKTIRWYKKIIFHVIDIATFNAFFIYKEKVDKKATYIGFRDSLIKSLIKTITVPVTPGIPKDAELTVQHCLQQIPLPTGCKRKSYHLNCKSCTQNKKRRQTKYQCKTCPNTPPLCVECFANWHKN